MLEPILKGLVEWIYSLMVDIMSYASGELLGVLSMNLDYFETTAPVISEIVNVFVALGWALLIGNMVFQLMKSMASGLGFEAEDPKIIFLRTFVFSFLLMASRQICDIGLSITGKVIDLLELPDSIEVVTPNESMFDLGGEAKWLLVIIVGVVLMVQMVKLLFEIGERYVITSVLTFFSPMAFAMGGSKNTNDIFKSWCRMYGSMMILMIMNIVFLKLIMSAMSQISSGGVLIWLVFVVALTRVARKIDSHIGKLGLNPAQTGDGLGSRIPGMMTVMAARALGSTVSRSIRGASSGASGGQKNRNGSAHVHRQSNSYTDTKATSEKKSTSGGLGGAAYYTGEGSPSGNGTAYVNDSAAAAPSTRTDGHGGVNMNGTSVSGGNSENQNPQSGSIVSSHVSGNSPAAVSGRQMRGKDSHPPLQRKTSEGNAPKGNPISGESGGGVQFSNSGTEVQNRASANIHGPETQMRLSGGQVNAIPLPKGGANIESQGGSGESKGADIHAAVSQQSSIKSHTSSIPLPKNGEHPEGAVGPTRGGEGSVIQTSGVSSGVHVASVPLPKAETTSGGSSDGGRTSVQGRQSAASQNSGIEVHGSRESLPKPDSVRPETPHGGAADIPHEGHSATHISKSAGALGNTVVGGFTSRPYPGENAANGEARKGTAYVPASKTDGGHTVAQVGASARNSENSGVRKSSSVSETSGAKTAVSASGEKVSRIFDGNQSPVNQSGTPQPKNQTIREVGNKNGGISAKSEIGGKENPVMDKGVSIPRASDSTVVSKSSQPSEASRGDKGQMSAVTNFEHGGDTNIDSRNYTMAERTVEKESETEYGKNENLPDNKTDKSGTPRTLPANTAFSRNSAPRESGEPINHEYTRGKYDPAAGNRKTDNRFFVKETLKESRIRREREKSRHIPKRGDKDGSAGQ